MLLLLIGIKDDGFEKGFHPYLLTVLSYLGDIVDKRFFFFFTLILWICLIGGIRVGKGKSMYLSNSYTSIVKWMFVF